MAVVASFTVTTEIYFDVIGLSHPPSGVLVKVKVILKITSPTFCGKQIVVDAVLFGAKVTGAVVVPLKTSYSHKYVLFGCGILSMTGFTLIHVAPHSSGAMVIQEH